MLWALEEAPIAEQGPLLVLIALAERADKQGMTAWPTNAELADRARCSVRSVIRYLQVLQSAGLIRPGDSRFVDHIPANHRPNVWDLDLTLRRPAAGDDEVERVSGDNLAPQSGAPTRGDTPVTSRGVAAVTPTGALGVTADASRGDSSGSAGVTAVAHIPSLPPTEEEPSNNPLAAAADATTTTDGLFEAPETAAPAKGKRAPKPPDPLRQHADRLCDPWWQSLPIKPAGKRAYPNVVDLVMVQIQAGRSDDDIAYALARCGVAVAQGSLNMYFAQCDQRRAGRGGIKSQGFLRDGDTRFGMPGSAA